MPTVVRVLAVALLGVAAPSCALGGPPPAPRANEPVAAGRRDGEAPPEALPDCASLPSAGGCVGASLARRGCESFGPKVVPAVGQRFVACLQGPGKDACDTHAIAACGLDALTVASADESHAAFCSEIATECEDVAPEITAGTCTRMMGAWRPALRQELVDCLKAACGSGAFGACLP